MKDPMDQSAQRLRVGCCVLLGVFFGALFAPFLQRKAWFLGVDQYSVVPAVVIVLLGGILGGALGARR